MSKASLPTCCQEMVEHLDNMKIERVKSAFERDTGAPGFPFLAVSGRQGVSRHAIV